MSSHQDLIKKLRSDLEVMKNAAEAGPLVTACGGLSDTLTGIIIALALLPCQTYQSFVVISEIFTNLRYLQPAAAAMEPTAQINDSFGPVIVITLKLIEGLTDILAKLFKDLKERCKDKSDCSYNLEKSGHSEKYESEVTAPHHPVHPPGNIVTRVIYKRQPDKHKHASHTKHDKHDKHGKHTKYDKDKRH